MDADVNPTRLGLESTRAGLSRARRAFVDVTNELGLRVYRDLVSDSDKHGSQNLVSGAPEKTK